MQSKWLRAVAVVGITACGTEPGPRVDSYNDTTKIQEEAMSYPRNASAAASRFRTSRMCAESRCSLDSSGTHLKKSGKATVYKIARYPGAEVIVSGLDGNVATGIFAASPSYKGEQKEYSRELEAYYWNFVEFSEALMNEFLPIACPKATELLRALATSPLHEDDTPYIRCGSQRVSVGMRDGHGTIIIRRDDGV